MKSKSFSRLSDSERSRKLAVVIRGRTSNMLSARRVDNLVRSIPSNRQYTIAVHPVRRKRCWTRVAGNALHVFVPKHLYERK